MNIAPVDSIIPVHDGPVSSSLLEPSRQLAVFGATPAFREKLYVGRPNVGDRESFLDRVGDMLDRMWLTNDGLFVQQLEQRIAAYIGVRHCVAVWNGTVALEIAIRALGLSGEVIIPSYTFIATADALQWQQITPVFADIKEDIHNLDPNAVERMIAPRTTGIIAVHQAEILFVKDRSTLLFRVNAAVAFDAHDSGKGREDWHGRWVGAVRPKLAWRTDPLATPATYS